MRFLGLPTHAAKSVLAAILAVAAVIVESMPSHADSVVNFWLSNADAGPAAPMIYAPPGAVGEIQIWARPAVGYRLSAFSLDLVAEQVGMISLENVEVFNPQVQAMPAVSRHQIVFDSSAGLETTPNEIYGFLGFSFFDNAMGLPNGGGIGPACGGDPCCSNASGAPSWHIATVAYQAGMSLGATELFLEIGEQGISQSPADANEPQLPTDTSAVFGLPNDTINQWSVPAIGGTDHRHDHQGVADAVIRVASADFDQDGDVDGSDFLTWQRGRGAGVTLAEGDADGDADVDGADLAVWRFQLGATFAALPAGSALPEPAGFVTAVFLATLGWAARRPLGATG